MTEEGLEVGYLPQGLRLHILDGNLVKAAARMDDMLLNQSVNVKQFGAYILTSSFYPGSDRERAAARAIRKGLSAEKAKADADFYRESIRKVAAVPYGDGLRISIGASILSRKLSGFNDHFNHFSRGKLYGVETASEWGGVNGTPAKNLYDTLRNPVDENTLLELLEAFQITPAQAAPARGVKMSADALLEHLLGTYDDHIWNEITGG